MTDSLKPCPFCGGEVTQKIEHRKPRNEKDPYHMYISSLEHNCVITAGYGGGTALFCDTHSINSHEDCMKLLDERSEQIRHNWNTRTPAPSKVTKEQKKDLEDLSFRLDWWVNLHYEEGCKYAHDILLDHREKISAAIRALLETEE